MKYNNQCSKCGSHDIIHIPGWQGYESDNVIPTGGFWGGAASVSRYLCGQCGFSEEWVDSPEDIAKVRMKYAGSKSE